MYACMYVCMYVCMYSTSQKYLVTGSLVMRSRFGRGSVGVRSRFRRSSVGERGTVRFGLVRYSARVINL